MMSRRAVGPPRWKGKTLSAILLDLDGTLLDTLDDITVALNRACNALHVDPPQALTVGDSVTDVLAARAAGLPVVCVPYGYNEGSDPPALSCDAFTETLSDLPAFLLSASPAVNSFSQPA
jgi:phosphoglycolate phosphatase